MLTRRVDLSAGRLGLTGGCDGGGLGCGLTAGPVGWGSGRGCGGGIDVALGDQAGPHLVADLPVEEGQVVAVAFDGGVDDFDDLAGYVLGVWQPGTNPGVNVASAGVARVFQSGIVVLEWSGDGGYSRNSLSVVSKMGSSESEAKVAPIWMNSANTLGSSCWSLRRV